VTIHYHGTPITPTAEKLLPLAGRHFCVRFGAHDQDEICHRIGQSVMLDNGAFSFWRQGRPTDWGGYYSWAERWLEYPTTWAVIPDVIDGDVEANDALVSEWPFASRGNRTATVPRGNLAARLYRVVGGVRRRRRYALAGPYGRSDEYALRERPRAGVAPHAARDGPRRVGIPVRVGGLYERSS
jgi:hypothetical protein